MEKIEEIKAWIKRERITRQELAEKIGVSKGTVNNWLCGADPIPYAKLQYIETLMQPAVPPAAVSVLDEVQVIVIKLTCAEYAAVCAAVEQHNAANPGNPLTVENWARQRILEAAARSKAP